MRNQPGHTLLELMLVLAIAAITLGVALIPARHARSVLAVHAARSELTSLTAVARSIAVAAGSADLVIDAASGSAWIQLPGSAARVGNVHAIAERHGVRLIAARSPMVLHYDALGIGRMANAVVQVTSGTVTGTVTISAYGRARQS